MTPALEQIKALPARWRAEAVEECNLTLSERRAMKRCADRLDTALQALSDEAGEAVQQLAECFRLAGGDTECVSTPEGQARQAAEVVRDLRACYDEAIRPAPAAEAAPQGGDGLLPDALVPVAREWYALCERAAYVDRIRISGKLAEAIVAAVVKGAATPPSAPAVEGLRIEVKPSECACHPETCNCPEYFVAVNGELWSTGSLGFCERLAEKIRRLSAVEEMSPDFTDSARAALAWVLYHHQGGSSPVGQPIRFALGMGAHEPLPDWRIAEAKWWAERAGASSADFRRLSAPVPQEGVDEAMVERALEARLGLHTRVRDMLRHPDQHQQDSKWPAAIMRAALEAALAAGALPQVRAADFNEAVERADEAYRQWYVANGFNPHPIESLGPMRAALEVALAAALMPKWTDEQCIEFMAVALRHVEYKRGSSGPTCDDIRMGVHRALAAARKEDGRG